jgi:hypothetical protein
VFPVRYGLSLYILFRRNFVFKGLTVTCFNPKRGDAKTHPRLKGLGPTAVVYSFDSK